MSLTGTIAALGGDQGGRGDFWKALAGLVDRLQCLSKPEELQPLLKGADIVQAVVVDGAGMAPEALEGLVQAIEKVLGKRDIPLVCLVDCSFRKAAAIRPDAILTHPVPPATVCHQIRSLIRLKTKKGEATVRMAALNDLDIPVPKPTMPVAGGRADNRPSLLTVGTRGNFSQVESVLGAKVQLVAALTADMANLYLNWRTFDAVVLDQPNTEAMDTLLLLRNNPIHHDLPIILLTEGLDKATARQAYMARATDVLTLHSTRADLFLRLTTSIRTRRLDRQTHEVLLRCQDAMEREDGTIANEAFRHYLQHAKEAAQRANRPLTASRLTIEPTDTSKFGARPLLLEKPALRLIRRLVRIEDLALIVEGTGIVTVFPGTTARDTELIIDRIRGIMRNTPVTLEIGAAPLRLDATARVAAVNTAA